MGRSPESEREAMRKNLRNAAFTGLAIILYVLFFLPLAGTRAAEESPSYYAELQAILADRTVLPQPDVEDAFLIVPPLHGAGMEFGDDIDKAVGIWGKPNYVSVRSRDRITLTWEGGLVLSFEDNRLWRILARDDRRFRFSNGLTMGADLAEIEGAFGEPTSVDVMGVVGEFWYYKTDEGFFSLRLRFGRLESVQFEASMGSPKQDE